MPDPELSIAISLTRFQISAIMKRTYNLAALLMYSALVYSQDLQLGVHVLPTSVIGDPAIFNIAVRNTEEEPARNVTVQVKLHPGVEYRSHTPNDLDFNPETGIWQVGEVGYYKAKILGIIATFKSNDEAILQAEVSACTCPDPDSTPGNGVDTNGNGVIVHDTGDEDDGDAAQIGPFKQD